MQQSATVGTRSPGDVRQCYHVLQSLVSFRVLYTVFIVQAYQISQYAVPCGGIFLSKWRSSFAGSSDGKMNVQSACAVNTRYNDVKNKMFKTIFLCVVYVRVKLGLAH
jgi:hypothetical protein